MIFCKDTFECPSVWPDLTARHVYGDAAVRGRHQRRTTQDSAADKEPGTHQSVAVAARATHDLRVGAASAILWKSFDLIEAHGACLNHMRRAFSAVGSVPR